jgi:DNA-binding NarL/FixJ family response regulator
MTIRVLLVDDVPEVRRLVSTTLRVRGGFEVVGEASDGAEAIRLTGWVRPDVVVLDLGLPDLASRDVLTGIRAQSPASKVVVFSGTDPAERDWIQDHVEGYVVKDAQIDYLADLLESVGQHGSEEATLELPQSPESAAVARAFVAETVNRWELGELLDDALLVTSELATNAVTHADSSCTLRLSLGPRTLRIDVTDTGQGTPEPQPASYTEEHGRGLLIVAAVSTAWGLESLPGDGKQVWAELAHRVRGEL